MTVEGWYPDPSGGHELRWFDGQIWTDHVADPSGTNAAGLPAAAPAPLPSVAGGSAPVVSVAAAETPLVPDHPAVPASGGGLLYAFAGLLVGAAFLPFASAGGSAEPLASDLTAAAPVLVLAAGAATAAVAGKRGYDVGPALGGGAVLVFSVLVAVVAPVIKALFDLSDAMGGSFEPNAGLVCFVVAGVVGVLIAIPVFTSVLRSGAAGQMPAALGWLGAGGTAVYLWGVTRPAYEGAPLLTGDWFIDAALVTLLAVLVLPALMLLTIRTAAAAALLAGVLLFPAMSWYQTSQGTSSGFGVTRPAGFDEMGIGLVVALSAAVIGIFGYARKTVQTPEGVAHVSAQSSGAAAIAVALVVVFGLVALNDSGGSTSFDGFDDGNDFTDTESFTGDGAPPECIDAWINGYTAPIYCEDYG